MNSYLDPRTPVLVGGGQLNQREPDLDPIGMIAEVARRAAHDAQALDLAKQIDSIRVVGMLSWRYRDPGSLVADRLGATVRHTVYTGNGGSHPQALVNDAAADIANGRCDVVLVGGAEAWRTRMAAKASGEHLDWEKQDPAVRSSEFRPDVPMQAALEMRAGLDRPTHVYPLFEEAIRAEAGRTIEAHRAHIAGLWSRFSSVSVDNPAAWSNRFWTPNEIATPSPTNRMISWPYTKLMNSNNHVEQAAAVIVCSADAARRAGIPEERWVYLLAGTEASDTPEIAARPRLAGSPAIREAGALALELAGLDVSELGPVDLYSCFPSAVQVAAQELGLPIDSPERPLTITGGLTFAGGPWNNYSTHAIATMIAKVRESNMPGLVTANSGYLTKHSIGIYGSRPGAGFRRGNAKTRVDQVPRTPVDPDFVGVGEIEACTVTFDRDGNAEAALGAIRTPSGARTLAVCRAADIATDLTTRDAFDLKVDVLPDGTFQPV